MLVVPSSAVSSSEGSRRAGSSGEGHKGEVTVVTTAGTQETREVEVGVRNRVSAEIKSGLKEGELVVVGQGGESNGASMSRNSGNRSQRGMRMPPMF